MELGVNNVDTMGGRKTIESGNKPEGVATHLG